MVECPSWIYIEWIYSLPFILLLALWINFLQRKSHILQDSHSKKIHIDLNNLNSNLRLCENVSSFHPNNQDEWRRAYLQRDSCQPFCHVSLKKISGALCLFNPN